MSAERETVDRLRLIRTEGVGPITYRRLLERYPSATAALAALPRLASAGGRQNPPNVPTADEVEQEIKAARKAGARLVFLGDADYPPLLAMIDDAPPCLVAAGNLGLARAGCVALVGGRNASANGQRMAEVLAADLAASIPVVSGLARGIDTAAHLGAMQTGRTIAVIAGGIDRPYPPENAALQQRIAETGLVLTEAAAGTVPQARHFPRRNRIIAGLSLGVVVVEAALRSGSLITARLAQEAGREVFAVPGSPLDPRARGGNDLIRQGAVLVEAAADVLANLPKQPEERAPGLALAGQSPGRRFQEGQSEGSLSQGDRSPGNPPRRGQTLAEPAGPSSLQAVEMPPDALRTLLALLSFDSTTVDELVRLSHLPHSATMAVLLELELAGRIEMQSGNRVALLPA